MFVVMIAKTEGKGGAIKWEQYYSSPFNNELEAIEYAKKRNKFWKGEYRFTVKEI